MLRNVRLICMGITLLRWILRVDYDSSGNRALGRECVFLFSTSGLRRKAPFGTTTSSAFEPPFHLYLGAYLPSLDTLGMYENTSCVGAPIIVAFRVIGLGADQARY